MSSYRHKNTIVVIIQIKSTQCGEPLLITDMGVRIFSVEGMCPIPWKHIEDTH